MFDKSYNGNSNYDNHYKMCKKIAQLTKVIYNLKSRSDDNEFVVQTLHNEFMDENKLILEDLNSKIDSYKDLVVDNEYLLIKIKELKIANSDKENELVQIKNKFQHEKYELLNNFTKIREDHLKQVNEILTKHNTTFSRNEQELKSMENSLEKSRREKNDLLEEIKEIKKENECLINQQKTQKRSSCPAELTKLVNQQKNSQNELNNLKCRIEQLFGEHKQSLVDISERTLKKTMDLATIGSQMEKKIKRLTSEKIRIEKLNEANFKKNIQIKRNLDSKVKIRREKLHKIRSNVLSCRDDLKTLKECCGSIGETLNQKLRDFISSGSCGDEIPKVSLGLQADLVDIEKMKTDNAQQQTEMEELKSENISLKETTNSLDKNLKSWQSKTKNWKTKYLDSLSRLKELEKQIKSAESENDLRTRLEGEMKDYKEFTDKELISLQMKYDQQLMSHSQSLNEKEILVARLEKSILDQKIHFESLITRNNTSHESLEDSLRKTRAKVTAAESVVSEMKRVKTELEGKIRNLTQENKTLQESLNLMEIREENKIEKLQFEKIKNEFHQKELQIQAKLSKEINSNTQLSQKMKQIQAKLENNSVKLTEKDKIITSLTSSLNNREKEFSNLKKNVSNVPAKIKKDFHLIKENFKNLQKTFKMEIDNITPLTKNLSNHVGTLARNIGSEMSRTSHENALAMSCLEKTLRNVHENEIKKVTEKGRQDFDRLLVKTGEEKKSELRRLEEGHQAEVEKMNSASQQERDKHLNELSKLNSKIENLSNNLEEIKEANKNFEDEKSDYLRQIEDEGTKNKQLRKDVADKVKEYEDKLVKMNKTWEETLQKKLDELILIYRNKVEQMTKDFEISHHEDNKANEELSIKLDKNCVELKKKELEVMTCQGKIEELENETKRLLREKNNYQLELINREKNFNQMFSSRLNINKK